MLGSHVMTRWWKELKKRSVLRWLVRYSVAAFALLQGADIVAHTLDTPRWVMVSLVNAVAVGLVAVAIAGWFYEWAEGGFRRFAPEAASEVHPPPPKANSSRLKRWAAIVVMLAGVSGASLYFRQRSSQGGSDTSSPQPRSDFAVVVAPYSGPDATSIAEGRIFQAWVGARLRQFLNSDPGAQVLYEPALEPVRTLSTARKLGRQHRAQLVVWGEIIVSGDSATIISHVDKVKAEDTFDAPVVVERLEALSKAPVVGVNERRTHAHLVAQLAALRVADIYSDELHRSDRSRSVMASVEPVDATVLAFNSLMELRRFNLIRSEQISREGLVQYPHDGWLHLVLGMSLMNQGKSHDAQEAIARARELAPKFFWGNAMIAISSMVRGEIEQSVSQMQQAVDVDPGKPAGWEMLSQLQFFAGKTDEALVSIRTAIRLDPSRPRPHAELSKQLAAAHFDGAVVELRKAIDCDPDEPTYLSQLGLLLLKSPKQHEREEGLKALQAAVKRDPENGAAHSLLGDALGNYDLQAQIREQRIAVEYSAAPAADRLALAQLLIETRAPGLVDEGMQLLRKLQTSDDVLVNVVDVMAEVDEQQATQLVKRFLQTHPQIAWAHGSLAALLFQSGATSEAKAEVEKAIALEPQSPWALMLRAHVLIFEGDPAAADAMSAAESALGNVPARLPFVRAAELGDWNKAATLAKRRLAVQPIDEAASMLLIAASVVQGNFKEAREVALTLGAAHANGVQSQLYAFVALSRLDHAEASGAARSQLLDFGSKWKDRMWPYPVYELFTGQAVTEAEVVSAAKARRADTCEAHYFLAAAHSLGLLASADGDTVGDHLKAAVATRNLDSLCYDLSRVELAQASQPLLSNQRR